MLLGEPTTSNAGCAVSGGRNGGRMSLCGGAVVEATLHLQTTQGATELCCEGLCLGLTCMQRARERTQGCLRNSDTQRWWKALVAAAACSALERKQRGKAAATTRQKVRLTVLIWRPLQCPQWSELSGIWGVGKLESKPLQRKHQGTAPLKWLCNVRHQV